MRKPTVRISRYDPERDDGPRWETYHVGADPMDRVLDVLLRIKWEQANTLALRYSCAHGVCGSDAMRIYSFNRLACKTLVGTLPEDTLTIEPLLALPVVKDLVVDMKPFWDHYKSRMPYLVNDEPPPTTERLQAPGERARYDDTAKCILCAACTTACPPFWHGQRYVGPAAIVNEHRFLFDSRDRATAERLEIMNDVDGAWRCRKVVIFGFGAGQELSEHTSSMLAVLQLLSGEAQWTLGDETFDAGPGAFARMQAGPRHAIRAKTPTVMLLLLLRSGRTSA